MKALPLRLHPLNLNLLVWVSFIKYLNGKNLTWPSPAEYQKEMQNINTESLKGGGIGVRPLTK